MNKPVAYGMLTFCKNCGEQNPYQYRELTDEEIAQVHKETFSKLATDLDFAKAILRKAQEK